MARKPRIHFPGAFQRSYDGIRHEASQSKISLEEMARVLFWQTYLPTSFRNSRHSGSLKL